MCVFLSSKPADANGNCATGWARPFTNVMETICKRAGFILTWGLGVVTFSM